jgi:hypothetical protein
VTGSSPLASTVRPSIREMRQLLALGSPDGRSSDLDLLAGQKPRAAPPAAVPLVVTITPRLPGYRGTGDSLAKLLPAA